MIPRKDISLVNIRKKKEQGAALVEVVFAISILTIGLLALASMQVSSIRGNAFAGGVTVGTCLATDRLEKLMGLPYTHTDLSAGNHSDPTPPSGYAITWNVADDSPLNDTKTISLTVNWTDHGAPKSVSLQRIVPRII
jgi:type IV pilus assembly protein PilV